MCVCMEQVGEQAPAPQNEAVRVREHPGAWYAAGESSSLQSQGVPGHAQCLPVHDCRAQSYSLCPFSAVHAAPVPGLSVLSSDLMPLPLVRQVSAGENRQRHK